MKATEEECQFKTVRDLIKILLNFPMELPIRLTVYGDKDYMTTNDNLSVHARSDEMKELYIEIQNS